MKYQQSPNQVSSEMDNEVVMMSIEQGRYFGLGELGSFIWRKLANPITATEISEHIIQEYDVGFEQALVDTQEFLDQLLEQELIITLAD